ncbi:MAG: peptide-N4-(N-acetyl-beta- glucosaminyl)asparagine amidase [Chrysothrix sp. TS-e1954]|nr:MAG: peptide-N4-(N-acetyl-beta- glucosaminyl)asparagine amidase [Chrysothrix sp. TS-e1954]
MGDRPPPSRQPPPPPTFNAMPEGWEKDLTEQFRQKLSTLRMNQLSRHSSSASTRSSSSFHFNSPRTSVHGRSQHTRFAPRHGSANHLTCSAASDNEFPLGSIPRSYNSLQNIPIVARPPQDNQSQQFRNKLILLSETPCRWENPGLLDEAMKQVPLKQIYDEANEEHQLFLATAASVGKKAAWGYQDCIIRALLNWFKTSFFSWVNNPPCSRCGAPTYVKGQVAPTPDEKARSGNTVELYQCAVTDCKAYERLPRYSDAFMLMQTRKGRSGEWANCFSMLCRAMGSRVRWVWNSEDHVWTEVYSIYRKRWVHVDSREAAFDKPLLYTEGWNRGLAYCIAFSADGAMDVTRRYCRNPGQYGLDRNKVPEPILLHIMDEIRSLRRRNMDKDEKFRLEGEDMRESRELRHYYVSTITDQVAKLKPRQKPSRRVLVASEEVDAQKARERREARERSQEEVEQDASSRIQQPSQRRPSRSPDNPPRN